MSYQVKLTKGTHTTVFGTYETPEQAETIAATHRGTGYWSKVTVERV